ncbi:MAG TPA: folylpolyglutamate synthase/dihydrofolate synthase family protein [candidate division Zixibacteria bacterium]|nr:folylpolyglutamate synthase/dihydrofolate synthase family protein [candidate division Zixibacteria bacterium]
MTEYESTLQRIYGLRGGVIDLRLDRMERALSLFGHPEKAFPAFHIAGTNGKGSTAAMLHRILTAAGYRTALYTSPHLVSFTERIRVGEDEIAPEEVVALDREIRERTKDAVPLTFFEFVTVMAFVHFARCGAELAVVEVGLGGRLDATNLVFPLVSLITTVSMDHEAYLGSDLASIAAEKGGIIKEEIPVVCGLLPPEAQSVVERIARERRAPLHMLGREFSFTLKNDADFDYKGPDWVLENLSLALMGRHQRRNAAVALAALEQVRKHWPVDEGAIRAGLRNVVWPGRLEILRQRPAVVLDGAHNGEGIRTLVEEMRSFRGARKVKVLFASMADKDWRLMLDELGTVADELILTRVRMERSASPDLLAAHLGEKIPRRVVEDPETAVRTLIAELGPDDVGLVAGSLYLLGEVRPVIQRLLAASG